MAVLGGEFHGLQLLRGHLDPCLCDGLTDLVHVGAGILQSLSDVRQLFMVIEEELAHGVIVLDIARDRQGVAELAERMSDVEGMDVVLGVGSDVVVGRVDDEVLDTFLCLDGDLGPGMTYAAGYARADDGRDTLLPGDRGEEIGVFGAYTGAVLECLSGRLGDVDIIDAYIVSVDADMFLDVLGVGHDGLEHGVLLELGGDLFHLLGDREVAGGLSELSVTVVVNDAVELFPGTVLLERGVVESLLLDLLLCDLGIPVQERSERVPGSEEPAEKHDLAHVTVVQIIIDDVPVRSLGSSGAVALKIISDH